MVEDQLSCMFHLRRVQFQTFVKEKGRPLAELINDGLEPTDEAAVLSRSTMILLDKQTKIGRNPELVDVVLHSVVHSNMISRDHSEIVGEQEEKSGDAGGGRFMRYFISDRSLNGTYVNDTRVKDLQQLKEGDLIKFGHVNGAAIKAGEYAPQQSAEFIFRFERALPNYGYFGYSPKGTRVQAEYRRAYMQINSDRVLPTEVYSSAALAAPPPAPQKTLPAAPSTGGTTVSSSNGTTAGAVTSTGNGPMPISLPPLPVSASTSSSATASSSSAALPTPGHAPAPPTSQLAHLAAVAAASTHQNAAAGQSAAGHGATGLSTAQAQTAHQQQQQTAQQTLNALNHLGLGPATDEQVAAMNAQLRSLMASHDAMSAMERLAAQQQWQKSLLNLNSLQQQNPLIYGHAFPAAAAAAAALFTGIGGIDLNSAAAAAAQPNAAQYAAAASLWPNIRASLPAATAHDWTVQQQQKAAALAHQLQLRLPGNLYQQPPQQQNFNSAQQRAASAVTMASSLFGAPSAFSLPGSHGQQQQSVSNPSASNVVATAAGLLIAAHSGHQQPSTSSSASSAAYSSCTSSQSQPPGIRPAPLSRGASTSSLGPGQSSDSTESAALTAAAAQLAAARHLAKEALETDQKKANWPNIGAAISCSTSGPNNIAAAAAAQKVSPIVAVAAAAARMPASAFQANPPVSHATAQQLQRIPGIASALAAAAAAVAQQQHQQQQVNGGVWQAGGTPPMLPTPSATPGNQLGGSQPLGTPPIQQPLAQRIFSGNSLSLSGGSKSSNSSSGISSASSAAPRLQSPRPINVQQQSQHAGARTEQQNRDSLSTACTSSLNSSGTSSAFSTPASTSLSTLTAAMFAAEEAAKRQGSGAVHSQQQRRGSTNSTGEGTGILAMEVKGRRNAAQLQKHEKTEPSKAVATSTALLNCSNGSISGELDQLQMENKSLSMPDEQKSDGGRQLMECDSSVPSPPSKPQQDEEQQSRPDSREGEKADQISRKRHSDSGGSNGFNSGTKTSLNGPNKPRAVKQARKSNEVARLLNDLTAGNCSWQYMAEKQQQRSVPTKTQSKVNNKEMNSKAGRDPKKPLRLDERKQLEIEKKKAHKMMRQISDSESSGDERKTGMKDSIVADSEEEVGPKKNNGLGKKKKNARQRSSSSNSGTDPTFAEYMREQDVIEGVVDNNNSSADSDLDNYHDHDQPGKKGKSAGARLHNGGTSTAAGARKHLSSAPTKKTPAATMGKAALVNGRGEEETAAGKKRGPKPAEEKKSPRRTRKNTAGSTNSTVATAPVRATITVGQKRGKLGRKAGTAVGRGRKPAASDDDEPNNNNNSAADSDSEAEVKDGTKKTKGASAVSGGATKSKRGRKAGTTGKKAPIVAANDVENTVMEDWTGGTGDPEKCAHGRCQRPKEMSISWVQCDQCDEWFHSICVFGKNIDAAQDEQWYCAACHPKDDANEEEDEDEASTSVNTTYTIEKRNK